jgi:hypothetical protein
MGMYSLLKSYDHSAIINLFCECVLRSVNKFCISFVHSFEKPSAIQQRAIIPCCQGTIV